MRRTQWNTYKTVGFKQGPDSKITDIQVRKIGKSWFKRSVDSDDYTVSEGPVIAITEIAGERAFLQAVSIEESLRADIEVEEEAD
jgi:hypothetical protein